MEGSGVVLGEVAGLVGADEAVEKATVVVGELVEVGRIDGDDELVVKAPGRT